MIQPQAAVNVPMVGMATVASGSAQKATLVPGAVKSVSVICHDRHATKQPATVIVNNQGTQALTAMKPVQAW